MSNQKIDRLLEKFSSKLAEMTESKNGSTKNPNNSNSLIQPKEKPVNLIDDFCNKDLSENKSSMIQKTHSSNHSSSEENEDVGSSSRNIDMNKEWEEEKKKEKDKIIRAISQVVNARSKNEPNIQSTESINNPQTRLKSSSPNPNYQNTPQESKTAPQSSPPQNLATSLMPKVSSMNNLIKLSSKLTPQSMLSEIKTRGWKDKISPIRYLLYFCIEKILYTLWKDNGAEIMSIKLNNPMQEKKFLCAEILKGVIELLTYFNNLERPLISKIIMSVFNRLGLPGIFNESWLPSCVKANMSIFQKTKAKVEELLEAPKTKSITSNIFNNIPNYENLRNYDHLGLELEDEDKNTERIDELDKEGNQNKLFFFKKKPSSNGSSHHFEGKTDPAENKNGKKKLNNIRKEQTDEESEKEFMEEKGAQKEILNTKKLKEEKFEICLQRMKVPENTRVFCEENDEEGHVINKVAKKIAFEASIPEKKTDKELQSQKRSRPESKYLEANEKEEQDKSQIIHASRQEIQQMIEEHLFNNINEITEKIMRKFNVKPVEIKEVLNETLLNKAYPTKVLKDHNITQRSRVEEKPKKPITAVPLKPKNNNNIVISEAQKKNHGTPLTNKELIYLVDKTSVELANNGCSQQEIINELFKLLEVNNVSYEKKQEILEAWFESKESGLQ